MPLMNSDLYDALLDAGASDEKARKGAASVANYEQRLAGLEGKMDTLRWMMGTNVALTLGVLWKVLTL